MLPVGIDECGVGGILGRSKGAGVCMAMAWGASEDGELAEPPKKGPVIASLVPTNGGGMSPHVGIAKYLLGEGAGSCGETFWFYPLFLALLSASSPPLLANSEARSCNPMLPIRCRVPTEPSKGSSHLRTAEIW